MPLEQVVSLFSAFIAFVGLLFVALQLRAGNRQQELSSLVEIYDINRQLIGLGFTHPQLFAILSDAKDTDPVWERRYLQLWLNQLSLVHAYLRHSVFEAELKTWQEREIAEFMSMNNVRRHWQSHGAFYPISFQVFVNDCLRKGKPPETAPVTLGR